MKLYIYRGLLQKQLVIEVSDGNATRLAKLAQPSEANGVIKDPSIDFVGEVISLHKKRIITNFYLGEIILNKDNISDSYLHANTGPRKKHIWHLMLFLNENGKKTRLLHARN